MAFLDQTATAMARNATPHPAVAGWLEWETEQLTGCRAAQWNALFPSPAAEARDAEAFARLLRKRLPNLVIGHGSARETRTSWRGVVLVVKCG